MYLCRLFAAVEFVAVVEILDEIVVAVVVGRKVEI